MVSEWLEKMGGDNKLRIEKFNGKDFTYWLMQITDYLQSRKLVKSLKGKKPDTMSEEDWEEMDAVAFSMVRLTLSKSIALACAKETTTAGLIARLKGMYEKPSAANQIFLMRQFFNLTLKEGGSVTDHINQYTEILGQLAAVDIDFSDKIQAVALLSSLPESWSSLIISVSTSMAKTEMSLDDVKDILLGEEMRRRNLPSGSSSALIMDSRSRGRSKTKGKKLSARSKSRTGNKEKVVCWNCNQKGHFKSECKAPRKQFKKKEEVDSVAYSEDSDEEALVCCLDTTVDAWVLDSGASFHSTSEKLSLNRAKESVFS